MTEPHTKQPAPEGPPNDGPPRPYYSRVLRALQTAHDACLKHPDRPTLGMSHGPFAGVNEALGIVASMEIIIAALRAENGELSRLRAENAEMRKTLAAIDEMWSVE